MKEKISHLKWLIELGRQGKMPHEHLLDRATAELESLDKFISAFLENFTNCEYCHGKGGFSDNQLECRICHGTGKHIKSIGVLFIELPQEARELVGEK